MSRLEHPSPGSLTPRYPFTIADVAELHIHAIPVHAGDVARISYRDTHNGVREERTVEGTVTPRVSRVTSGGMMTEVEGLLVLPKDGGAKLSLFRGTITGYEKQN